MQTGIALDDDNNVHLTFFDPALSELRYAKLANGATTWSAVSTVAGPSVAPQSALALEAGRIPHVVYYETSGTPALKHAELSGSTWNADTIETFTGTNTFVSIAVGADRNPRVAYYNSASSTTVFASLSGIVWSTFTVRTSTFGGPVDLVLTSTDGARIALVSGSTTTSRRFLSYAMQSGSSFAVSDHFIIGTDTSPLGGLSLALDSAGRAHIAVYDGGQGFLEYVNLTSTGAVASSQALDATPAAGVFNDIAVNDQDEPMIVYVSSGAGLRRASFDGSSWTLSALESGSVVGVGPSLVFNRFGSYLGGYYNGDSGEVKFITDAARDLSLSGAVLDFLAAPIPGAVLTLSGTIATTGVSISGATGVYSVERLFEGNYALVPSLSGYAFQPSGRSYSPLTSSMSAQNFQGGPISFDLVGNLFDPTKGEQVTVNYAVVPGHVLIRLYTLQGRMVRTLVNEDKTAGSHSVLWDGRTADGDIVASGIYLVRLETEALAQVKKIAVVK